MTTNNLYLRLRELLPGPPLLTGTVTTVHGDGTVTVTLSGGGTVRVRNPVDAGTAERVYLQGDAITGPAPDLPHHEIVI